MTQSVFLWPFFHTKAATWLDLNTLTLAAALSPLLASLKCSCSAGEGDLSVWLGLLLRTFADSVPIYFASFVFSLLTVELANGHSQMLVGVCMKRTSSHLDAREASRQVTSQDQGDCKLSDFQSIGPFQLSWLKKKKQWQLICDLFSTCLRTDYHATSPPWTQTFCVYIK